MTGWQIFTYCSNSIFLIVHTKNLEGRLDLSLCFISTVNPSGNPIGSSLKIYPENCLFSPSPPLLGWSRSLSSLTWIITTTSYPISLLLPLLWYSIFSIYVEMEVTIVTPMIKIFLCIPTSLSIKVLVPKMTYKTLSTMSLLLLYPHLCSLCLLRTSHTDLSALSLISQASSCFKTFALAVLPAWDVHPLDFCLILSWPPLCLYSNVIFSVTTSPFKITTHCPLPPCQHSLSWHCASFFFTIALITIRYAKYFSCLF